MNTAPITPHECHNKRTSCEHIPDCVFKVINELIEKKYCAETRSANVFTDEICDELVNKHGLVRDSITENKWLDVEPAYRKSGWKVEYIKTAWNVPDPEYFIFSTKKLKVYES